MSIISYQDLRAVKNENPNKDIVFCSGSFDLTHAGHVLFLEDCKKMGDVLVVGVGNDENMKEYKGKGRPILNEYLRFKMVDSLKPVDYCLKVLLPEDKNLFSFLEIVFDKLKPDLYIINDDANGIEERKSICKKYKIKIKVLKRKCPKNFDNVSTTSIINKIKNI